jgi:hypothetical protein
MQQGEQKLKACVHAFMSGAEMKERIFKYVAFE